MTDILLNLLLNQFMVAIVGAIMVAGIAIMITKKQMLTPTKRVFLILLIAVCLLYFTFVLFVSVSFGGAHSIASPSMP